MEQSQHDASMCKKQDVIKYKNKNSILPNEDIDYQTIEYYSMTLCHWTNTHVEVFLGVPVHESPQTTILQSFYIHNTNISNEIPFFGPCDQPR